MQLFNLGTGEIIVICVLALIFIGPKKLPELAAGLGKMIREVRKATVGIKNEIQLDEHIRGPLQELRDAATLPAEELVRRDRIKAEQARWEQEEKERQEKEAREALEAKPPEELLGADGEATVAQLGVVDSVEGAPSHDLATGETRPAHPEPTYDPRGTVAEPASPVESAPLLNSDKTMAMELPPAAEVHSLAPPPLQPRHLTPSPAAAPLASTARDAGSVKVPGAVPRPTIPARATMVGMPAAVLPSTPSGPRKLPSPPGPARPLPPPPLPSKKA